MAAEKPLQEESNRKATGNGNSRKAATGAAVENQSRGAPQIVSPEDIERLVAERTAELAEENERLRQELATAAPSSEERKRAAEAENPEESHLTAPPEMNRTRKVSDLRTPDAKERELRRTGLDVIGDVRWGTHFCLFYQTKEDLADILVPYFKAGLENNEFCMWVTSEPLGAEDATSALKAAVNDLDDYVAKGQIEILDYSQWYTKSGVFDADRVLQGWVERENQATKKGFDGLRLTGNTFWLEDKDWRAFADYEAAVDSVLGQYRMLALCTYSLDKCGAAEVMDVVSNHEFALIKRDNQWTTVESAERKRAEEALRQNEHRYRTLFEEVTSGLALADVETGEIVECNTALAELVGRQRTELIGQPQVILHPPRQDKPAARFSVTFEQHMGDKHGQVLETQVITKSGDIKDVLIKASLIHLGDRRLLLGMFHDITARKRTEEALRQSEESYRDLVEGTDNLVTRVDEEGKFTYVNHAVEGVFDLKPDECIGLSAFDFVHPEDRERTREWFTKCVQDQVASGTFENRQVGRTGRVRHMLWTCNFHYDESGVCVRVGGIARDITEQKRAVEALRESKEQLQDIIDNSVSAISVKDPSGRYILVNRRFESFFGLDSEEILGKTDFDLLDKEIAEEYWREDQRVLETGETVERVDELFWHGQRRSFLLTKVPLCNSEKRTYAVCVVSTDITDHKRAQEELRHSDERFRRAFEDSAIGMVLSDTNGRFTQVNQAICDILGYSEQELLSLGTNDITYPGDTDWNSDIARRLKNGEIDSFAVEKRYIHKDGHLIWGNVVVSSVRDSDGQMLYTLGQLQDITSRKLAEEALRDSEQRFRALTTSAPVGIFQADAEGNSVYVNEAVCSFTGLPSSKQHDGAGWATALHPDDRERVYNLWMDTVAGNASFDTEFRFVGKNEKVTWLASQATTLRDEDENVIGFIGTLTDITERKRAEEKLRASEVRFRTIYENAPVLIDAFDENGRCVLWNKHCRGIFGWTIDEINAHDDPLALFYPDPAVRDEAMQTVTAEPDGRFREWHPVTKDGKTLVTMWANFRLPDGLAFNLGYDITERRQAEDQVRRQSAVRNAINQVFRRALVCETEEELGKTCLAVCEELTESKFGFVGELNSAGLFDDIAVSNPGWDACKMPGSDATRLIKNMNIRGLDRLAMREGKSRIVNDPSSHPDRVGTPEGHPPITSFLGVPLKESGKTIGMIGLGNKESGYDATDQEAVEAVAVAIVESLKRKRAEVEAREASAELILAKEAAEAANVAKSLFLANMSHEIRTPMTAILGYADLLMSHEWPPSERREHLQVIHRQGTSLLTIINDILDLSKIEADQVELEPMDCSPSEVTEEVCSLLEVRAAEKNLRLDTTYSYPLPKTIRTDPVRLRQILVNLVGNAIKFTERGTVKVIVGSIRQGDAPAQMQFQVVDTGIGLSEEEIGRLFRPFTQADMSHTRRFGGTGLGLHISQKLAKLLGGQVEVQSEPGVGSTFTLTIDPGPLEDVEMETPTPTLAREEKPAKEGEKQKLCGRILLAEDVEEVRTLVGMNLERFGLEVDFAETGQIAIEKASTSTTEGRPYDLILMDIQMPQMDGYDATRRLRQDGWKGPIIALTAHAMTGDREKCLEAGCDDYISKPMTDAELSDTIARHLGEATPGRSAGAAGT